MAQSLKTKASFNLSTECRFPNGSLDFEPGLESTSNCNSWVVLDLTKGIGLDEQPLCTINEETFQWECPSFWVGTVPYAGIKPGLIVSGDGFGNAAIARGLVLNANYNIELAFFGAAGEFLTASLADVIQEGGDDKPGGGPPPKDGPANLEEPVDLLPTTCVTNELFEINGDGGDGWDFRDPIKYGYFGAAPYSVAIFDPDLKHIAIWFDMAPPPPPDGFTGPSDPKAEVQLHMRSKPDFGTGSDNFIVRHNFEPCLSDGDPIELNGELTLQSVDCRQVVRTDEDDNTFDYIEVTYVIATDPGRTYEFRLEAYEDFTFEPSRDDPDNPRAMTVIDKPTFCPLRDGTVGTSTDPKWVTPGGK